MAARHLKRGRKGEAAARLYLERDGYTILDTNWRVRQGELDIVCRRKEWIVFVEVKTRKAGGLGTPGQAVTREKQKRLVKTASAYLSQKELWDRPCRFDLITVVADGDDFHLEHDANVFELSDTVGRSHSAWQPW